MRGFSFCVLHASIEEIGVCNNKRCIQRMSTSFICLDTCTCSESDRCTMITFKPEIGTIGQLLYQQWLILWGIKCAYLGLLLVLDDRSENLI